MLCYEPGVLAQAAASGAPREIGQLDVPLLVNAAAIFLIFERSWGGLFMMVLLATIGSAVETQLMARSTLRVQRPRRRRHPDVDRVGVRCRWPPNARSAVRSSTS